MSVDALYSYLMRSGWIFLGGWTLLLLLAAVLVFRNESPEQTGPRVGMRQN